MFERPIRAVAILTSVFVLVSWALFAIDQVSKASHQSQAQIAGTKATRQVNPTPRQERARENVHNGARELVDDVNDVVLAPFAFLTEDSPSEWARRTGPALLALLLYGFGLGYVARFAHGRLRT